MIKKWRSAESYLGNTKQARINQRANLIPGNSWQKRRIKELRLGCFWEIIPLKNRQEIFKAFENKRGFEEIKNMPKEELKGRDYLNGWWGELALESKISIYKKVMSGLTKESRSEIYRDMEKCLKGKLEKGI
ncbi:hypothetical protein ES695_11130 [Candidatus Atribacteria bacterium 1244-E10-H5-B2]|nr:MAG: hypothetical protein ES695_11130 [Candidatus Atribacteria bacterium 1244-E10-H5-B2]